VATAAVYAERFLPCLLPTAQPVDIAAQSAREIDGFMRKPSRRVLSPTGGFSAVDAPRAVTSVLSGGHARRRRHRRFTSRRRFRLRAHSSRKLDGLSGSRVEWPTRPPSAMTLSETKPCGDIPSFKSINLAGPAIYARHCVDCYTSSIYDLTNCRCRW